MWKLRNASRVNPLLTPTAVRQFPNAGAIYSSSSRHREVSATFSLSPSVSPAHSSKSSSSSSCTGPLPSSFFTLQRSIFQTGRLSRRQKDALSSAYQQFVKWSNAASPVTLSSAAHLHSSSSNSPFSSSSLPSPSSSTSASSSSDAAAQPILAVPLSPLQMRIMLHSVLDSTGLNVSASKFPAIFALFNALFNKVPNGFGSFFPNEDKKSNSTSPSKGSGEDLESDQKKKEPSEDDSNTDADPGKEKATKDGKEKEKEQEKEGEEENDSKSGDEKEKKKKKKKTEGGERKFSFEGEMSLSRIVTILFAISLLMAMSPSEPSISFQDFRIKYLDKGLVDKLVVVNGKEVYVYLVPEGGSSSGSSSSSTRAPSSAPAYKFSIGSVDSFERQLDQAQRDLNLDPRDYVPVHHRDEVGIGSMLGSLLPTLLMIGVFLYIARQSGGLGGLGGMGGGMGGRGGSKGGRNIFSIGKANYTMVKDGEGVKTRFKDVAGLDEAKVEVIEFVKFLQNPDKFTELGAKIPKGALLVGPPGTGKTLLAKATAGESGVPFFSMSGSDFLEMFVGVGPARVRDLFAEARKNAPCIVFIDEIDAVGRARSKGGFSGGNDERENTLNQLLVEMDGFVTGEGVVVLAGTNRVDILDKALLRPGRFDRQISIDPPDIKGRVDIFRVHLKPLKLGHDADDIANRIAALTPGMVGADIANICNEAALIAARDSKDAVGLIDFERAVDRVIGGLEKKSMVLSPNERAIVAYHEAGHAVCGWFLEHADPLLKVTIVPRASGALGFAQYLPKEIKLYQEEQLTDMMCMALGGRAAEQIFFNKVSTGASDDLKKVTNIAYGAVTHYGFSPVIGNVSFASDGEQQFTKPYSDKTAETIDAEARKTVTKNYERTIQILTEKKDKVEALAKRLLKDETINHDVLIEVLGPRPFSTDAYMSYLEGQNAATIARKEDEERQKKRKEEEAKKKAEQKAEQAAKENATGEEAVDRDKAESSSEDDKTTSKTAAGNKDLDDVEKAKNVVQENLDILEKQLKELLKQVGLNDETDTKSKKDKNKDKDTKKKDE